MFRSRSEALPSNAGRAHLHCWHMATPLARSDGGAVRMGARHQKVGEVNVAGGRKRSYGDGTPKAAPASSVERPVLQVPRRLAGAGVFVA